MKFAFFDKVSGAVRQWQDYSLFNYAPAGADELLALDDGFVFPDTPRWVIDGELADIAPVVAPPVISHATLVDQAKTATRIQRQPIIGVLDGLQVSAIALGDPDRARVIETAKQGLRDITDIDLSACVTYEDMRLTVKARYLQLAGALPIDVRIAFSEALS